MYGFPEEFDAGTLVGRVLEAVPYASNVIVLAFEDEAVISASAPITYSLAADSDDVTESPTDRTGQLVGLVGLRGAGAEVRTGHGLRGRTQNRPSGQ